MGDREMADLIAPCKECHAKNESYIGCHENCEKYKEYKATVNSLNTKIRKEKELTRVLNGYNKEKTKGFPHSSFGKF